MPPLWRNKTNRAEPLPLRSARNYLTFPIPAFRHHRSKLNSMRFCFRLEALRLTLDSIEPPGIVVRGSSCDYLVYACCRRSLIASDYRLYERLAERSRWCMCRNRYRNPRTRKRSRTRMRKRRRSRFGRLRNRRGWSLWRYIVTLLHGCRRYLLISKQVERGNSDCNENYRVHANVIPMKPRVVLSFAVMV